MIKWNGVGETGLSGDTMVEVVLRSGYRGRGPVGHWDWRHNAGDDRGGIIEYRILPPVFDPAAPPVLPRRGLPADAAGRKAVPLYSGCVKYFPDALAAVAELSRIGNDQHNPGKPLHWDRSKSGDERDALMRHLLEAGTIDGDGVRHSTKVAWRALANLQKELEGLNPAPHPTSEST